MFSQCGTHHVESKHKNTLKKILRKSGSPVKKSLSAWKLLKRQVFMHSEITLKFWLHVNVLPFIAGQKVNCKYVYLRYRCWSSFHSATNLLECRVMTETTCKTKLLLLEYCCESLRCDAGTGSRSGCPYTQHIFANAGLWEVIRIGTCSLKRKIHKSLI
jgi:hypothetical protein